MNSYLHNIYNLNCAVKVIYFKDYNSIDSTYDLTLRRKLDEYMHWLYWSNRPGYPIGWDKKNRVYTYVCQRSKALYCKLYPIHI